MRLLLLLMFVCTPSIQAAEWNVNPQTGHDENAGSKTKPLATIQKAISKSSDGDVIILHPKGAIYRQSFHIRNKSNLTILGNGVTLDGTEPIENSKWEQLQTDLFRKQIPIPYRDRQLLILDGVMQRMGRTQSSNSPDFPPIEELKRGQFRFEEIDKKTGWLYVRGSIKNLEWSVRVNGLATSGTCRNIVVRNLNTRYFLNDGFNLHGDARQMTFENIQGYDCFDEGFSAHDTCECFITNGKFWGNENGVADVNFAETAYKNSQFFRNVNFDVLLIGKSHKLTNCIIINSTQATALNAGPRSKTKNFRLEIQNVSISTKSKKTPAPIRINGGTVNISHSNFDNVNFNPTGATLKFEKLMVNGKQFGP